MRSVVHWDGDRFFASIEQAADQRLRNRPVAVGAAHRGIVISASQEARRYGIRPGMSMRRARRACPALITVAGNFELYEQFFEQMLALCEETTPLVEPVSVGAAYLDLTGTKALLGRDAGAVVSNLRQTIRNWLRVSVSAGIASNKTVARMAARWRKPAGQVIVPAGSERAFLAPFPVSWLEGIGEEARQTLELAGVRTLGALARAPLDALQLAVGRQALGWQRRAQGVDEDPVLPRSQNAPRWREVEEFAEEAWDEQLLLLKLRKLLERLMARARRENLEARRLTLTLRYIDREEASHSLTLTRPSNLELDFEPLLPGLLSTAWRRRVRLRAVALTLSRIYRPSPQLELFAEPKRASGALGRLAAAIDALRRRYGEHVISKGLSA